MELKLPRLRGKGSRKGLLLTLVTVVIVVLMLSEVLTYVYTSIEFDTITAIGGPSSATATLYDTISNGYGATLSAGLSWSLSTLQNYESYSPSYKANQLEAPPNYSSSAALSSIIYNGTLYNGKSRVSVAVPPFASANLSIENYTVKMEAYATSLGLKLNVTNATVTVYQSSPTTLSAEYRAFAVINSSYGSVSYPLVANATVSLNGQPDPYSQVSSGEQLFSGSNSVAKGVSGSSATGTLSGYLFAKYPTYYTTASTCTGIVSVLGANVSSYIIMDPNANSLNSITCGAAGLVTYTANSSGVLTPYKVVPSTYSLNQPYGSILILGNQTGTVDTSGLDKAIGSQYVPSSAAPSYLSLLNGSFSQVSPYGVAPLGSLGRQVASFSGSGNILVTDANSIDTVSGQYNTVSMWIRWPPNSPTGVVPFAFYSGSSSYDLYIAGNAIGFSDGSGTMLGAALGPYSPLAHQWINVVAVFFNGDPAPPYSVIYIDGVKQQLFTISGFTGVPSSTAYTSFELGGTPTSGYGSFNGMVANLQIYNITLSPAQAEQLYLNGINGYPVQVANLSEWMPLDGNANSYANQDGTAAYGGTPPFYSSISNYPGSATSAGSFYLQTGIAPGAGHCYSQGNCNYNSSELLYIPLQNLSSTASSSFGIGTSVLPDSAYFPYLTNTVFIANGIALNSISGGYDTVSFWMTWDGGAQTDSTPVYFNDFGLRGNAGCFGFSTGNQGSVYIDGTPLEQYANRSVNIIAELYNGQISSANDMIYVNGVQGALSCGVGSAQQTITTPGTNVEIGGSLTGGTAFAGSISDLQVYNSLLNANQVMNLYQNNSVYGVSPVGYWPLSSGYNGLLNQTPDIESAAGFGKMYTNGNLCTNANAINSMDGQCDVTFVPNYIWASST